MVDTGCNFVRNDNGTWSHRPWWKVVVNTPLRKIQLPFTTRPWLVASIVSFDGDTPVNCHGYKFCRVTMND